MLDILAVVFRFDSQLSLLCPAPIGWGHKALMAVVCLFVCLVPDPRSGIEGLTKLEIGGKDAHVTGAQ